ncbi:MAG TPA: DUF4214 domain-containing protein, partial [Acidimicrobiales bacterium]
PSGATIADGTATGTIVANGLLAGCPTDDTTTQKYVCRIYHDVLDRTPDADGKAYWVDRIDGGEPRLPIMSSFLTRAESRQVAVERLYQLYLGRDGDPAGVAYWAEQLHQGVSTDVIRAHLLASGELFTSSGGTNETWVKAVYQAIFRRTADDGGVAYWVGRVEAGQSRLAVVSAMIATTEGRNHVVIEAYQRFLDRSPTDGELSAGRPLVAEGGEVLLDAQLLASDEYRAGPT